MIVDTFPFLMYDVRKLESKALLDLFSYLRPHALAYAGKVSQETTDAVEDAIIIVFHNLIKHLARTDHYFADIDALRIYFLVSVRYHLNGVRIRRIRVTESNYTFWKVCMETRALNTNALIELQEHKQELQEVISTLPGRTREVIHALYFEGYNASQLARRRGVSKQAIHNLHNLGLRMLREKINYSQFKSLQ